MRDPLPIRYHHEGIAVVEKPFGLASQPTRKNEENLFSLLSKQFPYVGLHHRLDTPASGLILVTTKRHLNKPISHMFKNREIQRFYKMAVVGKTENSGTWSIPVDGQEATTTWKRLHYQNGYSIIEAQLHTGRKHQIRRHAAETGNPIIGDRRYGGAAGKLAKRLILHAYKLTFIHPKTTDHITVYSPPTDDLLSFLEIP